MGAHFVPPPSFSTHSHTTHKIQYFSSSLQSAPWSNFWSLIDWIFSRIFLSNFLHKIRNAGKFVLIKSNSHAQTAIKTILKKQITRDSAFCRANQFHFNSSNNYKFFARAILWKIVYSDNQKKNANRIYLLSNSIAGVTEQRKCVYKDRHSKRFWCVCSYQNITFVPASVVASAPIRGVHGALIASTHCTYSNKIAHCQLDGILNG